MLRILIDTNISISREDDRVLTEGLRDLLSALTAAGVKILVHPRSIDELRRDNDPRRREIVLSKIETYSRLESPPEPIDDEDFLNEVGHPSNPNDEVDIALLYSVHRNAVDYLITEDKRILKKAVKLRLGDRVLSIENANQALIKHATDRYLTRPPALDERPVHNLDMNDPFFNSLRQEYRPEFDDWSRRIAREGRKCWVYFENDHSIGALLIFKVEQESLPFNPPFARKKRLKLSTFKVTHIGYKIGELFVKLAIHHSLAENCEEIYLTHFTKPQDDLVELINGYGFERVAKANSGEDVFLKKILPSREEISKLPPTTISQKHYPIFYDGVGVRKFLVPIRPDYHEKLFIDFQERQTRLPEYHGQFIIEGNTIKKAYLCNTNNRSSRKGDLMLFYRSGTLPRITSVGVIESVHRTHEIEEITRLVRNRTVYPVPEIREMLTRPTTTFLFNWHFHFKHSVTLRELHSMGLSVPQTITSLPHKKYLAVKKAGGIDERFTVN